MAVYLTKDWNTDKLILKKKKKNIIFSTRKIHRQISEVLFSTVRAFLFFVVAGAATNLLLCMKNSLHSQEKNRKGCGTKEKGTTKED